jgi:hypothetical protein
VAGLRGRGPCLHRALRLLGQPVQRPGEEDAQEPRAQQGGQHQHRGEAQLQRRIEQIVAQLPLP